MEWMREYPTEEGIYWFYGFPYSTQKPCLFLVRTIRIPSGPLRYQLIQRQGIELHIHPIDLWGKWQKIERPKLPSLTDLEEK